MCGGGTLLQVKLTLLLAGIAVPINTVFGVSIALVIARRRFWGRSALITMLDLPFSISPVVTGAVLLACATPAWAQVGAEQLQG